MPGPRPLRLFDGFAIQLRRLDQLVDHYPIAFEVLRARVLEPGTVAYFSIRRKADALNLAAYSSTPM
jgi:hypothetical protein